MVSIFFKIWVVKLFFPTYWKVPTSCIYAQSVHETGNFTSNLFENGNNLFGMKVPSQRNNHNGSIGDFATFRSHFSSIKDYFQRQKVFNIKGGSSNSYMIETLNSNYAGGSSTYMGKWMNHLESEKTNAIKWKFRGLLISSVSIPIGLFIAHRKGAFKFERRKKRKR